MRRFLDLDWLLVLPALFLLCVGLLTLYSFSSGQGLAGSVFFRQLVFSVAGVLVAAFLASLDYRHLLRFSTHFYFVSVAALLFVAVFGKTVRGTSGWISFGDLFQFQPVEAAKIALLLFLASFISKKNSELGEWVRVVASLVLSSVLIFLVLKQPDLGSSLVLSGIWIGMILVSGIRFRHVAALLLVGVSVVFSGWFFLEDYQRARIDVFLHPESDRLGSGYNVIQSMVAVGSGGVFGKGVGYGSQSQLNFLPEKHTDFIFAVVAEELGLIGVGAVILAYALLLFRISRIAFLARDNTGYLIGVGAFSYFSIQIFINIGMNIGVLPVTGLPAPFLSYGGSSLLSSSAIVGILLGVSRLRRREDHRSFGSLPESVVFSLK